jgi:hypothetical protein
VTEVLVEVGGGRKALTKSKTFLTATWPLMKLK